MIRSFGAQSDRLLGGLIKEMSFFPGLELKQYLPPKRGDAIILGKEGLSIPEEPIIPYIEGDGVGKDITPAMKHVVDAAVYKAYGGKKRLIWWEIYAGENALELFGSSLPEDSLTALKFFHIGIKGPLSTPVGEGFRSLNVAFRQVLDLYACVRPVRWLEGVPAPLKRPQDVDMVIFRENTEDLYAGIEWESGTSPCMKVRDFLRNEMGVRNIRDDAAIGIKPISPSATKRIVRMAIRYALEHNRTSVTLVHKANIMKFTEGGFRKWGYEVALQEFADVCITEEQLTTDFLGVQPKGKIVVKDRIADSMLQQILLRPAEYSVLAMANLNGDYLSDALAASVGGLGLAPGVNMNDEIAFFEATHGTAPKHAGLDKANPGSLILSAVLLLEHIGWKEAAAISVSAMERTIREGTVTYDLARQRDGAKEINCSAFAQLIVNNM